MESERPTFWAETKFVGHVPHSGLSRENWKTNRAGRTLRVTSPTRRDLLEEPIRETAAERGCDCKVFWVMHPEDARSCNLHAATIYVCQAQIESD
ncbi:MAG: hypothetical protein WA369_03030 [Candidatus Acidiferrales bacterium]